MLFKLKEKPSALIQNFKHFFHFFFSCGSFMAGSGSGRPISIRFDADPDPQQWRVLFYRSELKTLWHITSTQSSWPSGKLIWIVFCVFFCVTQLTVHPHTTRRRPCVIAGCGLLLLTLKKDQRCRRQIGRPAEAPPEGPNCPNQLVSSSSFSFSLKNLNGKPGVRSNLDDFHRGIICKIKDKTETKPSYLREIFQNFEVVFL